MTIKNKLILLLLGSLLAFVLAGCKDYVYEDGFSVNQGRAGKTTLCMDLLLSSASTPPLRLVHDPANTFVDPGGYEDAGRAESLPKEKKIIRLDVAVFREETGTDGSKQLYYVNFLPVKRFTFYDHEDQTYETRRWKVYVDVPYEKGIYKLLVIANLPPSSDNARVFNLYKSKYFKCTYENFMENARSYLHYDDLYSARPGAKLLPMTGKTQTFDIGDKSKLIEDPYSGEKVYPVTNEEKPIELYRMPARVDVEFTNVDAEGRYLDPMNAYLRLNKIILSGLRQRMYLFGREGADSYQKDLPSDIHAYYLPVNSCSFFINSPRKEHHAHIDWFTLSHDRFGGKVKLTGSTYTGTFDGSMADSRGLFDLYDHGEDESARGGLSQTFLKVALEDRLGREYNYFIPVGDLTKAEYNGKMMPKYTAMQRNTIYKLRVEQYGKDLKVILAIFRVAKENEVDLGTVDIYYRDLYNRP